MPLKEARMRAGLSQNKLAEQSGVNASMIQYYEQGKKDINGAKLKTLLTLCDTLKCGLRDLITDEETLELLEKVNY